jgi:hypothetical protein
MPNELYNTGEINHPYSVGMRIAVQEGRRRGNVVVRGTPAKSVQTIDYAARCGVPDCGLPPKLPPC